MPSYKFFTLDAGGRVDRGFDMVFPDDATAISHAKSMTDAARIEIIRDGTEIARVLITNGIATVI